VLYILIFVVLESRQDDKFPNHMMMMMMMMMMILKIYCSPTCIMYLISIC